MSQNREPIEFQWETTRRSRNKEEPCWVYLNHGKPKHGGLPLVFLANEPNQSTNQPTRSPSNKRASRAPTHEGPMHDHAFSQGPLPRLGPLPPRRWGRVGKGAMEPMIPWVSPLIPEKPPRSNLLHSMVVCSLISLGMWERDLDRDPRYRLSGLPVAIFHGPPVLCL